MCLNVWAVLASLLQGQDAKKILALCFLVVQNAGLVMLMRYVRTRHDRPMFLASTAVMMDEFLKFLVCLCLVTHQVCSVVDCGTLFFCLNTTVS